MNTFAALLQREWLEHKAIFIWTPVVTAVVLLLLALTVKQIADNVILESSQQSKTVVDGVVHTNKSQRSQTLTDAISNRQSASVFGSTSSGSVNLFRFFYLPLIFISLFALISSTYDERKDGSILFYKSMPISDLATIVSKYVFVAWIAPLAALTSLLLTQLLFVLWSHFGTGIGIDFAGQGIAGFAGFAAQTLLSYAVYGLWALPVFAWFLLVGAWASKAPLLWAIGTPLVAIIIEQIAFGTEYLQQFVDNHLFPYPFGDSGISSISDQLSALFSGTFWVGCGVGALLLWATVSMRRTHNES